MTALNIGPFDAKTTRALRIGGILVALAAASSSLAVMSACQNETRSTKDGPRPIIVKVAKEDGSTAFTADAKTTDAGDLLACCSFNIVVTYDLEYRDFISKAYITWDDPRTRGTRFEYAFEAPEDPGPDGIFLDATAPMGGESPRQRGLKSKDRTVAIQVDLPNAIAAKGVGFDFSVVLVTGQGAESLPSRGSVRVNPVP